MPVYREVFVATSPKELNAWLGEESSQSFVNQTLAYQALGMLRGYFDMAGSPTTADS